MRQGFPILRSSWLLIVLVALFGCASGPELVNHGLIFHFADDSPEAELLDYRYGTSFYGASDVKSMGRASQGRSVHGGIRRGDDLYVKWRLKTTGEVFEKTVDLRSRLPKDIEGCRIYFMVKESQLYVYLITPQRRAKEEPPNGPSQWRYLKTITLYPDPL